MACKNKKKSKNKLILKLLRLYTKDIKYFSMKNFFQSAFAVLVFLFLSEPSLRASASCAALPAAAPTAQPALHLCHSVQPTTAPMVQLETQRAPAAELQDQPSRLRQIPQEQLDEILRSKLSGDLGKLVFREDCEKFSSKSMASPGQKIAAEKLDEYTANPSWSGENIYPAAGTIKLGTSSAQGKLLSPQINLAENTGIFHLFFRAEVWKDDIDSILLIVSQDSIYVNGIDNQGKYDPSDMQIFAVECRGGNAATSISFVSAKTAKARFFLDDIEVYQVRAEDAGSDPVVGGDTAEGGSETGTGTDTGGSEAGDDAGEGDSGSGDKGDKGNDGDRNQDDTSGADENPATDTEEGETPGSDQENQGQAQDPTTPNDGNQENQAQDKDSITIAEKDFARAESLQNTCVFPSPTRNGNISIVLPHGIEEAKIRIFNLLGKEKKQIDAKSSTTSLSLPQKGIYILEIKHKNSVFCKKLIYE